MYEAHMGDPFVDYCVASELQAFQLINMCLTEVTGCLLYRIAHCHCDLKIEYFIRLL